VGGGGGGGGGVWGGGGGGGGGGGWGGGGGGVGGGGRVEQQGKPPAHSERGRGDESKDSTPVREFKGVPRKTFKHHWRQDAKTDPLGNLRT